MQKHAMITFTIYNFIKYTNSTDSQILFKEIGVFPEVSGERVIRKIQI